jgi:hypothetical protein
MMRRMLPLGAYLKARLKILLLAGWTAFLLVGSLQPLRPASLHNGLRHHVGHIVAFGILALLARISDPRPAGIPLQVFACALFGTIIEVAQYLMNGDRIEWEDIGDDVVGITIFTALHYAGMLVTRRHSGKDN